MGRVLQAVDLLVYKGREELEVTSCPCAAAAGSRLLPPWQIFTVAPHLFCIFCKSYCTHSAHGMLTV